MLIKNTINLSSVIKLLKNNRNYLIDSILRLYYAFVIKYYTFDYYLSQIWFYCILSIKYGNRQRIKYEHFGLGCLKNIWFLPFGEYITMI